jgi:hypothetical protein
MEEGVVGLVGCRHQERRLGLVLKGAMKQVLRSIQGSFSPSTVVPLVSVRSRTMSTTALPKRSAMEAWLWPASSIASCSRAAMA